MRLVSAFVKIEFEELDDKLKEEFHKLSAETDDPIGQYIKLAKARGETGDTDKVLLELVVALHRKIDELAKLIKEEEKTLLPLKYGVKIEGIGFEYFKLKEPILIPNKKYYGRLEIAFFPQREVPIYFMAVDKQIAEILIMHDRDIKDYNAFVAARERAIIREKKGIK